MRDNCNRKEYVFHLLRNVNLFKTIRINLHYFPLKTAFRFPIILFGKVDISDCLRCQIDKTIPNHQQTRGIVLNSVRTGILRFGIINCWLNGFFCDRKSRFSVKGKLILGDEPIIFGNGCSLVVEENGILTIGGGVSVNNYSRVYCESSICIGKKSRISWDSQIFDTNFHYMIEQSGRIKRMNGEIFIGDECWIGNRVTIQKGTKISDKSVVASNSLLNKDFSSDGSEGNIYAGNPAILKRKGYTRVFDFGLQEKIDEYFKNYPKCDSVNIADVISELFRET